MEYLATELTPRGSLEEKVDVKRVEVRAGAAEVHRNDALVLQERAQKLWPDFAWKIEKTFSGRYVVSAY
jgi:hypothetical protein